MLTRPNIFNYAKKELSQDAVICWLLECCHSDDDKYRQIGIDFVRFILDNENIKEKDIELEKDSPRSQYKNMDVYANIRVGKTIIPAIFPNGISTSIFLRLWTFAPRISIFSIIGFTPKYLFQKTHWK